MPLVESVPNYSEGRRIEVVDRLAGAVTATPGVHLLDRTSDPSHNRSVLTMAGDAGAVCDALERTIEVAISAIDMETHTGEHFRIGAVDVIPFVPLGGTTMADAVAIATAFGERIARRFELPVYLYANAARSSDRVRLADVRRGEYEGLKAEIATRGRMPDFGPARMHPRAGAVAVGARPFLIAYNINLESADVDLAKRIARRVRESGGGLPKVQANGFFIEELGCSQVSMNLLDFTTTSLWRVWREVRAIAREDGVELRESELIGLAPLAAFLDVAAHVGADPEAPVEERLAVAARFLKMRDFSPSQALELRLAAVEAEATAATAAAAQTPTADAPTDETSTARGSGPPGATGRPRARPPARRRPS